MQEAFRLNAMMQSGKGRILLRAVLPTCPGLKWSGPFPSMAPMHSWDQMKPRTVYEKAVQDFTETARRLARLNQHFRQASFAEFEMLMALDDEVLKRYGLPKPMVKQALIKAYETVVLDQQRSRLDHDGSEEQIFGVNEQILGRDQSD